MLSIRKATLSYHEYYFYYPTTNETTTDGEVADVLGIDIEDYQSLMKRNYNGIFRRTTGITQFPTLEDAERALKYITGEN